MGVRVEGTAARARRTAYLQQALAGVGTIQSAWGRSALPAQLRFLAPATAGEFTARTGASDPQLPAITRPDGTVVIHPRLWEGTSALGRQVVLTHELVHVALGQARWAKAPRWVIEGSAEVTAYRTSGLPPGRIAPDVLARVRAGRTPTGPPTDVEVDGPAGYGLAWAWCSYLVARAGWSRFTRFVRAAGAEQGAGSEQAFVATYAASPRAYAARYPRWLESWS